MILTLLHLSVTVGFLVSSSLVFSLIVCSDPLLSMY